MSDPLVDAAPVGLGELDGDLRWRRVNAALAAQGGLEPSDLLGRMMSELAPDVGARAETRARRVLATGRSEHAVLRGAPSGTEQAWDVSFFPLGDGVGVVAVEVTARLRAEEALAEAHRNDALVARAGHLMRTALSVRETADLVAQLVVPELADWCFVELLRDTRIERVAWAHRDPSKLPWIAEFDRRYPLDPAAPAGSAKVIRTGQAEILPEVPDEMLVAVAQDAEHLRLLREIGFRSMCIVPLVARGRILGDLALATDSRSGRTLGPEAVDVARALADRCAVALDNAALYAQRDHVAVSLQEELLPPRLPSIPGIEVAARYAAAPFPGPPAPAAAGTGSQPTWVGGDFYDVFACDGGWQVLIGDVVGKGPQAAAVTGLARHTMRAAAGYERLPSRLLGVLNEALLAERPGRRLASVACVRLDPDPAGGGMDLTIAVGGHPLPLILGADGGVREAGAHGQLLGVEQDLDARDVAERLEPGELLVLYTDGVVEVRGPSGMFGEPHLRGLLAQMPQEAPTRALQRIEAAVLAASGGQPRDDLAMIALRPSRPV